MPQPGRNSNSQAPDSDLIDKSISFDERDMHKSWPMVKGCFMLIGIIVGFVLLSTFVFKNFGSWFNF